MRRNGLCESGLALAMAVACFALTAITRADTLPSLGPADDFAVLGLAGTETLTNSLVTINGNEGAVEGALIKNNAPSTINGNVFVFQGSQYSGPGTLTGSVNVDPALMGSSGTVQTDVNNAISGINGFSGFGASLGNITSATTLNATGSLTEVLLGNINLNNANLTLNGTSSQDFVIEATGNLSLVGTASLLLTGGLTPSNVIYYFNGSSCSFNTHVGDTVNGIMLAPDCAMTLDGTFNGELISGEDITLLSNATVNQPTPLPSPEPGTFTLTLVVCVLLAIGLWVRKRNAAAATL